jgi:exosortase
MKTRFYQVLLASPILFIWIWTWRYLAAEWSENEQYQFGFAVPPLALYLAWQNLPSSLSPGTKSWILLYVLAWPLLLLAEMLRLTDPLWRLTGGLWMTGATVLTIGYFAQLDSWVLVRRMIFPLCFLWIALPWPTPLENQIIQTLTGTIAAATTAFMNLAGVAAVQRGNTIELANLLVGIGTACTGIESFQASLMVSLFLVGLMRLGWGRGLALVIAGFACSLFFNLCRVLVLTWSAHRLGHENQAVHDWVGAVATIFIFGMILLIALWLRRRSTAQPIERTPQLKLLQLEPVGFAWYSSALFAFAFFCIPWIVSLSLGADARTVSPVQPRWQMENSNLPVGWSFHIWSPTSEQKSALRFSRWSACQIRTADGLWSNIVHLFWGIGHGLPSTAFYHTPALCMPSAGWHVLRDPEPFELVAYGKTIPFVRYLLERDLDRVLVLQYLSRGQDQDPFLPASSYGRLDRLKHLLGRSRQPVNEEILIYLPDLGSDVSDTRFANQIFLQFLKPVTLR